jgi:site-specific recombinase XerD
MPAEQIEMFPRGQPGRGSQGEFGPPVAQSAPVSAATSLVAALGPFQDHMIRQGFTENTVKAFLSDLRLLGKYIGPGTAVGEISTKKLNDFLTWMLYKRGVPCSPKTYARRVTTLKVFFGWLTSDQVLAADPAAPVIQQSVSAPLAEILYNNQVEKMLEVTRSLAEAEKPDARPHLLVSLLLQTGIKKGECMRIELRHIDSSDPQNPTVFIRYDNPRYQHKERKLKLPADWALVFQQYQAQYQPQERLFECTARNLEYVLHDVAQRAGLPTLSFEMLRWTSAVRDYAAGMDHEKLRQKMGLSLVSWQETSHKLEKLAGPGL